MVKSQFFLPSQWGYELESFIMQKQSDIDLNTAYICSPCNSDTSEGVYRNMLAARFYMYYIMKNLNMLPIAPHGYLPIMLCDKNKKERLTGLQIGISLLQKSDIVIICGDKLTKGMRAELFKALKSNIPVQVMNRQLYICILKKMGYMKNVKEKIHYNSEHYPLSISSIQISLNFLKGVESVEMYI